MKNTNAPAAIFFCGALFLLFSFHKTIAQQEKSLDESSQPRSPKPFYFAIDGQVAIPLGSLREYSKVRGGVRFEFGKPLKANPSLGVGIELSGIFSGSKKDKFKGLDVKTKTSLTEIHPFIRWTPRKNLNLNPFIDFSIGVMVAGTETTSEIVDEPTFLDQVLFDAQTEVETVTHQSSTSSGFSFGVGAGFIIKKFFMVGIRYHHSDPLNYIDKNDVYLNGNTLRYDVKRIPLDMIVVTIGIGIWGSPK